MCGHFSHIISHHFRFNTWMTNQLQSGKWQVECTQKQKSPKRRQKRYFLQKEMQGKSSNHQMIKSSNQSRPLDWFLQLHRLLEVLLETCQKGFNWVMQAMTIRQKLDAEKLTILSSSVWPAPLLNGNSQTWPTYYLWFACLWISDDLSMNQLNQ